VPGTAGMGASGNPPGLLAVVEAIVGARGAKPWSTLSYRHEDHHSARSAAALAQGRVDALFIALGAVEFSPRVMMLFDGILGWVAPLVMGL
jgi:hypothetical protein